MCQVFTSFNFLIETSPQPVWQGWDANRRAWLQHASTLPSAAHFLGSQSQGSNVSCPLLSPLRCVSGLSYVFSLFYNPLHALLSLSGFVLVSWGCCNKWPQTLWLKTTEIYSLPVLEARRLTSVSLSWNQGISRAVLPLEALEENLLLASSSSGGWGHSLACGCITQSLPLSLCCLLLCVCNLPLSFSYKDTCDWIQSSLG